MVGKTKWLVALLAVGLAAPAGSHAQVRDGLREGRGDRADVRGILKSLDARSITIALPEGREQAAVEKSYPLAADVEVVTPLGPLGRGLLFKEIQRGDIPLGSQVALSLSADQKKVEGILAESPMVRGILKAVDAKKRTLTLAAQAFGRDPAAGEEKVLTVAPHAEILLDDGRGGRFSLKEGQFDDLAQGAVLLARLSVDRKLVLSLQAEGTILTGTIKSIDVQRKSVTLVLRPAGRGEEGPEEKTLTIAAEAILLVDDGKGRRLSLKEARLADIPTGTMAQVKMSVDQNFVMQLRAEGPVVLGLFKGADPDKGTITIAIPRGRDEPEEKTYTLAKDARIFVDGTEGNLGTIKAADNGPAIQLRLGLDQRTVQQIQARAQARRE